MPDLYDEGETTGPGLRNRDVAETLRRERDAALQDVTEFRGAWEDWKKQAEDDFKTIRLLRAENTALRDALKATVAALEALSTGSVRVQRQWFRDHGMPEVADRSVAYSDALARAALALPTVRALTDDA